ncbi:MAG: response regulator [Bacteroidota bacterium]
MTAKSNDLSGYETRQQTLPRYSRIIIIDDSEIDLEVEKIIMKGINLAKTIDIRTKGLDVINELSNIKRLDEVPELIFLDLNMPGMNGLEFLNAFSVLPEFIKQKCSIVVVTSTNDQKSVDLTYSNPNVIDYVVKPLDAENARKFLSYDKMN